MNCSDGVCEIITPAELKKRTEIQSFWRFVRKNNVEVVMQYGRLYIIPNGCNLDALCEVYGKQIITCKITDGELYVEARGLIGENYAQDEIIAACGDWEIKENA